MYIYHLCVLLPLCSGSDWCVVLVKSPPPSPLLFVFWIYLLIHLSTLTMPRRHSIQISLCPFFQSISVAAVSLFSVLAAFLGLLPTFTRRLRGGRGVSTPFAVGAGLGLPRPWPAYQGWAFYGHACGSVHRRCCIVGAGCRLAGSLSL